jgi:predicted metal-dependent HD superfamily phosphohydrolase
MILEKTFKKIATQYTSNTNLIDSLWNEIHKKYTHSKRHYHNLEHLETMIDLLREHSNEIADGDAILFALFYHDAIYDVLKKDNEEKSALLCQKRLKEIHFPVDRITLCNQHILATKNHTASNNRDTNLFTDVDLAILGYDWEVYQKYFQNIRKEYSIYPDFMYNAGRKKIINHLLSMDSIYKTETFKQLYEQKARNNLKEELKQL